MNESDMSLRPGTAEEAGMSAERLENVKKACRRWVDSGDTASVVTVVARNGVIVHHLLTHTSGLRDEDLDSYAEGRRGKIEIPSCSNTQSPLVHEYLHL